MTPPWPSVHASARAARRRGRCTGDSFGNFFLADDQRRQKTHHVVAGADGDHLFRAQLVDHFGGLRNHAQADQQTFAAHLGDHRRVAVLQFGEPLLEQQCILSHAFEKFGIGHHDVEHGVANRHRQWIAAEGRAVRADGHPLRGFRRRQAGADRKAAAKRLRNRHDVGLNAAALIGEHFACADDAGLYFVEYQQETVLVAKLTQRAQECRRRDPHAAFALDRLDQESQPSAGPIARLTASRSPNGTWSKPSTGGPKPSRYFLLPVAAIAASVRP